MEKSQENTKGMDTLTHETLARVEAPPEGVTDEASIIGGRYRLERRLRSGGMGVVYLGTQVHLGRPVAVKILSLEEGAAFCDLEARFRREAATLARLSHPNIVTTHDYGRSESGHLFLVMEYIDGPTLLELIETVGPLPMERILPISIQICRALREAHRHGVVHCDLKPANIMLSSAFGEDENDQVIVLDFGLAELVRASDRIRGKPLSESDVLAGTPKYMAPEQICCEPLDPRADIYALGVLLFHLVAGRPPFDATDRKELLRAQLEDRPPPMHELGYRRRCPEPLEWVISRCLEKSPDDRYRSVALLMEDLKRVYRSVCGYSVPSTEDLPNPGYRFDSSPGASTRTEAGMISGLTVPPLEAHMATMELAPAEPQDVSVLAKRIRRSEVPNVALLLLLVSLAVAGGWLLGPGRAQQPDLDPISPQQLGLEGMGSEPTLNEPSLEVQVRFESSPSQALVFEGGQMLGRTPFVRHFERNDESRSFEFRIDQKVLLTIQAKMDRPRRQIFAELFPQRRVVDKPTVKLRRERKKRSARRRTASLKRTSHKQGRLSRRARRRVLKVDATESKNGSSVPKLDDGMVVPKVEGGAAQIPRL